MTGALALLLAAALAQNAAPAKAAPAKSAKPSPKPGSSGFAVALAGGVAAIPLSWQSSATWSLNAETARLEASQEAPLGPAVEAALSFRFARSFGVAAAFGWARRDGSATVEARLPHPLYLERPRGVTGTADGLDYRQIASHLALEWRPLRGRVDLALFAGPSFLRVNTELVERATATESYPYDEAVFSGATAAPSRSAASLGWNAGAAVATAVASRLDLGLQARYSRATPELEGPGGGSVALDAGGLDVTAFLRLRF